MSHIIPPSQEFLESLERGKSEPTSPNDMEPLLQDHHPQPSEQSQPLESGFPKYASKIFNSTIRHMEPELYQIFLIMIDAAITQLKRDADRWFELPDEIPQHSPLFANLEDLRVIIHDPTRTGWAITDIGWGTFFANEEFNQVAMSEVEPMPRTDEVHDEQDSPAKPNELPEIVKDLDMSWIEAYGAWLEGTYGLINYGMGNMLKAGLEFAFGRHEAEVKKSKSD